MHGFRRRFSILLVFLFGFFVPARAELSLLPLEERRLCRWNAKARS